MLKQLKQELQALAMQDNLRRLPVIHHQEREVDVEQRLMLNLSSNDYLGLAVDTDLRRQFLAKLTPENFRPAASSSRLLTGNFAACDELEETLAELFGTESALTFSSGYHANTGILPAVSNARTLILADKLIHASLIDGIRLSTAKCIRYRHNRYDQLERLLKENHANYERIIIVTESIFSMDGDEANLSELVRLKRSYPHVMLYVDEAHAFGVRGTRGLGCSEEQGCIADIDFLVGTFGKALASVGAYIVCRKVIREYLVNRMRTFIFTTALPPVCVEWTLFVLKQLPVFTERREHLAALSRTVHEALLKEGCPCPSTSHIIPLVTGDSHKAVLKAEELQRKGFYVLPVRPPTVPEGTSRLRLSLTAALRQEEVDTFLINYHAL